MKWLKTLLSKWLYNLQKDIEESKDTTPPEVYEELLNKLKQEDFCDFN